MSKNKWFYISEECPQALCVCALGFHTVATYCWVSACVPKGEPSPDFISVTIPITEHNCCGWLMKLINDNFYLSVSPQFGCPICTTNEEQVYG